jgi:CheY-like chemotaxis protein
MRPLRVLVVEDDPLVGPLLAEVLEDIGHVVALWRSTRTPPWRRLGIATPI